MLPLTSRRRLFATQACLLLVAVSLLPAQGLAPAAPNATVLAKYDKNRDGQLDLAERAAMELDEARAAKAVQDLAPKEKDEVVQLSPFEVTAAGDRGYFAANTMSGTRLNSKIEDLASSITVVTKEQMADFAMLDINDIFNYEAGTEGTGNYTDFEMNVSGNPVDNTQVDPHNANRIRGIGSANIAMSNFETSGRVPIDPTGIDAVEISRGPNSNLFGLGNASGTVNMVASSAHLSRDRSQAQFRADSFDGYRASLDLNRVLKPRVLSVRGSAVFQHDGFDRKPSGTNTGRLNGMVKYQPSKSTTISASHSIYRLNGNRPNTTMPRDGISYWLESGSPTWDPLTQTTFRNGQQVQVGGSINANFLNLHQTSGRGNSLMAIDQGRIGLWTPGRGSTTNTPQTADQTTRFYVSSRTENLRATQPLFTGQETVSSRAIYDWTSLNLAAMNSISEKTATSTVQIEHIFLNTSRQMLATQLGWFRENSDNRQRLLYGTPGSSGPTSGYLQMDPNTRLLTGEPNPNFLRPYIGVPDTVTSDLPLLNDTYRGQLAYKLDLTGEKNWLRWLGLHQLAGYAEYKHHVKRKFAYRDVIVSNHAWLAAGVPRGGASSPTVTRGFFQWYVGDNSGANVDYAPKDFSYGTYDYTWGNALTGQRREPAQLGLAAAEDAGTGTSNILKILKTQGVVIQSHLLKGRIVTTFGLREDQNYLKRGVAGRLLPDGLTHDFAWDEQWADGDYSFNDGRTKTAGVVVKPLRWLHLHANKSDSFLPANPAISLHGEFLPDPSGLGEDYGFTLSLFSGKLIVRANQYTTKQINTRNGNSTTLATRSVKLDIDDFTTSRPFGLNNRSRNWIRNSLVKQGINPTEAQLDAEVAKVMQMSPELRARLEEATEPGAAFPLAEHDDRVAKGKEIEINYNPTDAWTVKLNVAEQETIDASLAPGLTQYLAERMPVWQSIIDADTGRPWYTSSYPLGVTSATAQSYLAGNVTAQVGIAKATEGKSRPQIRKYRANFSTNFRLSGITEHRVLKRCNVGGALRWEDKGAIGYYGSPAFPAVMTVLDRDRPIWSEANLYADLFVGYRTRLFGDKVGATFQLNVRNVQENGRLQAIGAFPDGTPNAYRIIDPRQFILTATFDL